MTDEAYSAVILANCTVFYSRQYDINKQRWTPCDRKLSELFLYIKNENNGMIYSQYSGSKIGHPVVLLIYKLNKNAFLTAIRKIMETNKYSVLC